MLRILSHIVTGVVGFFSVGPKDTKLAIQTMDIVSDRYDARFSRPMNDDEIEWFAHQCALFLTEHGRVPTRHEADDIVDMFFVR